MGLIYMEWIDVGRPGIFADKKSEIFKGYDDMYGKGNWRIMHKFGNDYLDFLSVCGLYEEAYLADSFRRPELWDELRKSASNVYDLDESDVFSGLDYLIQNNVATHLQDIVIRNVFVRRGWKFEGDRLYQIRSKAEPFGVKLSPGRVPFHKPEMIIGPHMTDWWDYNSVEDFYQSNKVLQIRK
jgi:hypothetical protein